MNDEDLRAMLTEFRMNAKHLLEHAEEAIDCFAQGDLENVQKLVGVSSYKISAVERGREAIMERLAG